MALMTQASEAASTNGHRLLPDDEHNRELVSNTHPSDWVNPKPQGRYNLIVLGAGTAGLTAAGGCAAAGGRVALIERYFTGGDCLVSGCVPSKGVISAARMAAAVTRYAADFGINVPSGVSIDFGAAMARMRKLRARISPADSVHHLTQAGVDVFLGQARFISRDTVEVDGEPLKFAKAVIATGGRAEVPNIPGLKEAGYLTNETVFQLTECPKRLAVIGAGPIGCELAQSFRRLGSAVTLIHNAGHILNREDADAAEIVQKTFIREGVMLVFNAKTTRAGLREGSKVLTVEVGGKPQEISCDAILVSAGRVPNTEGLNLEAAGVKYDQRGVLVNDCLQTTHPAIFAAGDIASQFKFTHTANVLGRYAMMNALFWQRKKASHMIVPWCTYTDPEIAHVGLYEAQAKEKGIAVDTITVPFGEVDRAILDGEDEGFVRVHLKKGTDKILGATIVAARAGDFLTYFTLLMITGQGLSKLSWPIYPYPTQSEILRRVANTYLSGKLTPLVKKLLTQILAWRR